MSHYGHVKNPFIDALGRIVGKTPPRSLVPSGARSSNDPRIDQDLLQSWVNTNLDGILGWSTAIGAIEAADHIVAEAEANGNIDTVDVEGNPAPNKHGRDKVLAAFVNLDQEDRRTLLIELLKIALP